MSSTGYAKQSIRDDPPHDLRNTGSTGGLMAKKKSTMRVSSACEGKSLNKPFKTPNGPKKSGVCVKDGNSVKIVRFGDPDMKIKKHIPERKKSFRARHNCDNPGPKSKARYWSCKAW